MGFRHPMELVSPDRDRAVDEAVRPYREALREIRSITEMLVIVHSDAAPSVEAIDAIAARTLGGR